ncbi:MAG: LysM peptidoglycan-binding domain-containing protein [Bacteroidetes bacterium]|nr:MAG: LysM peptidoglycan-binding domain-containing protein [Bacteroidota bacterium]
MKLLTFLLCSLLSLSAFAAEHMPQDSVGIKKVGDAWFILHKTEKGQGLFGIARRYNSSVDAITKANPEVKNGLSIGQIVLVPTNYKEAAPAAPKAEEKKPEAKKEEKKAETPASTNSDKQIKHTVKSGETLYAISRQYNVSVDEIKKLNKLSSNELTVGQELIIKAGKVEHTENYGGEEKKAENKSNTAKPDATPAAGNSYEYNKSTGEVKESGFAVVSSVETMDQKRSFALHPTAPVGTIIMVTNTQNNKSVFIRVIGNTKSSDPQVVLMLSNASAERLGIGANDRVSVRLNYAR